LDQSFGDLFFAATHWCRTSSCAFVLPSVYAMRTSTVAVVFAFAVQAYGETAEQAHAEKLLNRLGLGNARRVSKGSEMKAAGTQATAFSDKMISKLTRNLLKKGKTAPEAPAQVMEEKALEQNMESQMMGKMMAKKKMSVKDKVLMQKAAKKDKEEERAFGEKVLENIIAEEKGLEAKVAEQKKKAMEIATIMEENAAKAKKPLSAAEKEQIVKQIEENSRKYALEVQEELMEAKVMEKTALGHALNPAEKKVIEKLELQVNERIAKSSAEIEEQVAQHKKRALELVAVMEENAVKAKKPLSEAEKVQVKEQIELNSVNEMKAMREALEEEKAMSKKAFGHPLNAEEQKMVEKYMVNLQQLDLSSMMGGMGM